MSGDDEDRRVWEDWLMTRLWLTAAGLFGALAICGAAMAQDALPPIADRVIEDEIIYFVMPDRFENGDPANDRGGIEGGRLDHGFDPTDTGFFHGGDLTGLTERLDYIRGLGATAIWLTPIFKNKAVQGPAGLESAGYHGYWITDFLDVDPHFGTREEFKAFVDAAHAREMKVYMDIITNHSADVIKYEECSGPEAAADYLETGICDYRPVGDYPFSTRGDVSGEAINAGFLGDQASNQTAENFAKLTNPDFAYTTYLPEGEQSVKNPAWMNDPIYYNNRGDSLWEGESVIYGDFAGLDDFMTTHPTVVRGFIDVYKQWITDFRVDGFRIDTAKHVNPEFWQAFTPEILDHARSLGIDHFHIFGEVYEFDPAQLARRTVVDGFPTVLDFALQAQIQDFVIDGGSGADFARLFDTDAVYAQGFDTARKLPTFLGNHDMGRFSQFIRAAHPQSSDSEQFQRLRLAHALLMFSRGVPTIYYGDEQGFVSDGNDRDARENMFVSQTESYIDNDLIGTDASTAEVNFDTDHPLYTAISEMAAIRSSHAALRTGGQIVRLASIDTSLLALSRTDETGEFLIVFNAEDDAVTVTTPVDARSSTWSAIAGDCPAAAPAPGSYTVTVPAHDYVLCSAAYDN